MSVLSTLLVAVGAVHLVVGVPAALAPGIVRRNLPDRYAEAVGGMGEWRQFGAALCIVGVVAVTLATVAG